MSRSGVATCAYLGCLIQGSQRSVSRSCPLRSSEGRSATVQASVVSRSRPQPHRGAAFGRAGQDQQRAAGAGSSRLRRWCIAFGTSGFASRNQNRATASFSKFEGLALEGGRRIGVLGKESCLIGSLFADQRGARPAVFGDDLLEPGRVSPGTVGRHHDPPQSNQQYPSSGLDRSLYGKATPWSDRLRTRLLRLPASPRSWLHKKAATERGD